MILQYKVLSVTRCKKAQSRWKFSREFKLRMIQEFEAEKSVECTLNKDFRSKKVVTQMFSLFLIFFSGATSSYCADLYDTWGPPQYLKRGS